MVPNDPPAIQGSILEGLFVRGPASDPELQRRLVALGFDAKHLAPSYPPLVFQACIAAAAHFLWPEAPTDVAQRSLGRMTVEGFQGTVLGSITLAAIRLLGPERLLRQTPKRIFAGQNYGHSASRELAPQRWELDYLGIPEGIPYNVEFVCGAIEAAMQLAGAKNATVEPARQVTGGFVMEIRWRASPPA